MPGVTSCRYAPMSASSFDPHRGDLAVGVGGELDVLDLAPALDRGERGLGALLGPPHRHAELAGEDEREDLLGVDVELRPEATAHRRRHDPDLLLGQPTVTTVSIILRMWGIWVEE